jgi:hypothetical protein
MIFTGKYNRSRMQVLVLDPSIIPISVDVVIRDNVYELHFKVEPEEMHENLKPVEMDEDSDDLDRMDEGDVGRMSKETSCRKIVKENQKTKALIWVSLITTSNRGEATEVLC